MNEVAKAVVANYNASELITRRAGVAREIEDELVSAFAPSFEIVQFIRCIVTHSTYHMICEFP